ncbi:hypothetical protein A9Q84_01350 [Halobacteriovorax marinus]|uniref:Type II toxin-antitoxin system mRNA interferase toxin, RelE/StbE family n=1 Tax=Halobacteriovorax marinus TaxID=97084 RepID=A0A1Y5FC85_9BACT|nr:hypothetical protein A9Q84_01350 [Halobacteriovorax marinus]
MWKVTYTKQVEKEISRLILNKKLTEYDLEIIDFWISIIEEKGPEELDNYKIFKDHKLRNEWEGFRSSSFSISGRIIYKLHKKKILIKIIKVTTNHNYKRD